MKTSIYNLSRCSSLLFGCETVSNQNTQQAWALALPEKEVIQLHLPLRLPCYYFTPVTSPAFGIPLHVVKVTTWSMASSHSTTSSLYKAWEWIHRRMDDWRLLEIPASRKRVAVQTEYEFLELAHPHWIATLCPSHYSMCVAPCIRGMWLDVIVMFLRLITHNLFKVSYSMVVTKHEGCACCDYLGC